MERPKLLLADDSVTIQRVVNLTFADEGIDVIAVGDGDAALREIASVQPDIVLADVNMPGPSGFEICSLLRGVEKTASIPVILLVGSFEPFDPEEAERVGADAFVTKPFQSIRQLVEQVKELLSKNGNSELPTDTVETPEAIAVAPEVDTTDIDSLYNQSFAEIVEMPPEMAREMAAASFSSDRLDDEMIETSYTAAQPNEQVDRGISAAENDLYSEVSADETGEFTENAHHSETEPEDNSRAYEETLQIDAPPRALNEDRSMHTAPTEEFSRELRDLFATTADAFNLDDIDLLDLAASSANEEISFMTPAESLAQGSNKRVVSISPELMETIVKKVVEKLSEKY